MNSRTLLAALLAASMPAALPAQAHHGGLVETYDAAGVLVWDSAGDFAVYSGVIDCSLGGGFDAIACFGMAGHAGQPFLCEPQDIIGAVLVRQPLFAFQPGRGIYAAGHGSISGAIAPGQDMLIVGLPSLGIDLNGPLIGISRVSAPGVRGTVHCEVG